MSALPLVGVLGGREFEAALAEAAAAAGAEIRHIESAGGARGVVVASCVSRTVPLKLLREIQKTVPVAPSIAAFEAARDRLIEKQLFKSLGILTAPFAGVESARGIKAATSKFGLPALLKSRLKGTPSVPIAEGSDFQKAWEAVGPQAVVEARVDIAREFTLGAVRDRGGETQFWPLSAVSLEVQKAARGCMTRILQALSYVGVMSLEFFEVPGGLLAHSFAAGPQGWLKPHALENHLRAVAGLPLAPCE